MRTHIINKKILRRFLGICIALCIILLSCPAVWENETKADAVTDYIGVRVGYPGMEFSDYVTVGDYHISEIEAALPIYEDVFSFFQPDQFDPAKYTYVVDTARGFGVRDLLSYARINYGDIYNLSFYVVDHNTIWSSFDRDELFSSGRYYFNNLPGHRRILYKTVTTIDEETGEEIEEVDYGTITGYDFEECWTDAIVVEPMLAIEDNWATFTEEFEEAGSDDSYYNTSTRFRLLYGQYSPTSSDLRRSSKYTRWVYVTLYGKPEIGDMPELNGEYGSHETTMTIQADYLSDPDQLSQFMNIYSTNEDVLRITNLIIEPVPGYSDLVTIRIEYDIVGDGEAGLGVGMGSNNISLIDTPEKAASMTVNTWDYNQPESESESEQEPDTKETEPDPKDAKNPEKESNTDNQSGAEEEPEAGTTAVDPVNETSEHSEPGKQSSGEQEQPAETIQEAETVKEENRQPESAVPVPQEEIAEVLQAETIAAVEVLNSGSLVYRLSADVGEQLEGQKQQLTITPELPAVKDITEVVIKDNSAEKEARRRLILIWTGAGCAAMCAIGALAEYIGFRVRLGGKKTR